MNEPFLGFWEELPQPFFALAPLANVTDFAFRQFLVRYSKPDVMWTEFVAADGLCHPKGREALLRDLQYEENERPIVAQLFTGHPEKMYEAAKLIRELGFDGLDINMGCPDKTIVKQGAGAACMRDPKRTQAIIQAAMDGVRADGKEPIPVSVKTRLGDTKDELETWILALLETKPAVITIHARTRKEMSAVPARWERVKRAVEIAHGSGTLIIGNGDIRDIPDARAKARETGCNGVMLGRAIFGNPWLFDEEKQEVTVAERLEATLRLTQFFLDTWGDTKSPALLKKHYKAYIADFSGARTLRNALMEARELTEVENLLSRYRESHDTAQSIPLGTSELPHDAG